MNLFDQNISRIIDKNIDIFYGNENIAKYF